MEKNKKLKSWSEAVRLNSRAFKIYCKRYPQMVLSRFIYVIWEALTPYIGIYFSALVIDELAGNRNLERLRGLVLLTLSSAAVIALGSALLDKWKETHGAGIWYKNEHIFAEKLLDMDYVKRDETETAELLSTIRQSQNGGGWGLNRVIFDYEALCSSALTMLGGVSLTVSLFVSRVPESAGGYTVLNNPLFMILLIAIMLAVTCTAPALSNKAGRYWALNMDSHNLGNRLFGYFGFLGYQRDIAEDVRIYRQDKM